MTQFLDKVILTRDATGRIVLAEAVDSGGNVLCGLPLTSVAFESTHHGVGNVTLGLHPGRIKFKENL